MWKKMDAVVDILDKLFVVQIDNDHHRGREVPGAR